MDVYLKYYDLLEQPPEATLEEISKNYSDLKTLYSGDSIEITALNSDFSQELQQDYLSRLDDAYEKLKLLLENKKPVLVKKTVIMDDSLSEWINSIKCFTGVALKSIRERMGVDLKDIFAATRIQPQYLEDIENEQFRSFRAEVYLRSYIVEYTRFLSLDTQKVLADYLPRYRKFHGHNADT
ncbi:MAG: helix-turn-helix domain-containing protein [Desulfuromonadaceae bacterium]|nr:helix-turn-helix domain-containing protein [Desulfuromonadaceae bacterium]